MAHADHRQVGQILILQLHVADGVRVGHADFLAVAFHARSACVRISDKPGSRLALAAVPGFGGNRLRHDVLQGKVFLNDRHRRVNRPVLPVVIGRDDGDQHIGIMPDLLRIHMVFVIAGVVALIVIHLVLQFLFLGKIGALRSADVLLLCRIGADDEGFQHRLCQRRT